MYKPIIIILAFSLVSDLIYAQNALPDSAKQTLAESNAIKQFNEGIGSQSRLYNGSEYNPYATNIKSNPYFGDITEWTKGIVTFDGYTYNNVYLKYDIYKDQVAALLFDKASAYTFFGPRTTAFNLAGHRFIYLSADTVKNSPGSGFYEQLYKGNLQALARYSKTMQNAVSSTNFETYFTKVNKEYYLQKGNRLFSVSSQEDLLDILKDRKKQLQQYIKANKIKYKQQPDNALVSIASYYDHLKMQ